MKKFNYFNKPFSFFKKKETIYNLPAQESPPILHCYQCGKKGMRTSFIPPRSFACKKCMVWWINPS